MDLSAHLRREPEIRYLKCTMADRVHKYSSNEIEVTFEARRCIHAAECVRGLPKVFDKNKTPWIMPDNDSAERIAAIVRRCPTGALKYNRIDSGEQEQPPKHNTVKLERNGPLYLQGDLMVTNANGDPMFQDTRLALCRCGSSQRKPLCDGSHGAVSFHAPAQVAETYRPEKPVVEPHGQVVVTPSTNGPLLIAGVVELRATQAVEGKVSKDPALCRCGASGNQPYCDGSHHRINFVSE